MASDFIAEVERLAESSKNDRPAAAVVPARASQPVVVAGLPKAVADRLAALERTIAEVPVQPNPGHRLQAR